MSLGTIVLQRQLLNKICCFWRISVRGYVKCCLCRAQDRLRGGGPSSENDKEASMELIQLDISRTFPHLCIFQRGGPYYDMLHCLLAAYVCYRPDVGYVQVGKSISPTTLVKSCSKYK